MTLVEAQDLFDWEERRDVQKDDDYGHVQNKRSIGGFGSAGNDVIQGGGVGGDSGRFLAIREAPPKQIQARQHGKVTLECSVAGTPAPQITWFKDGRPLYKDGRHQGKMFFHGQRHGYRGEAPNVADSTGDSKSKVTLECLDEEDAGVYECVASNGFSKTAVATKLDVVSFGQAGTACKDAYGDDLSPEAKPVINQWMDTYMQLVGRDALLTCRATGPHETYWTTPNNMPVDLESEKYQMTLRGDLIIRNLGFADMGMFQCTVKTVNGGSDRIQTFVYPLRVS